MKTVYSIVCRNIQEYYLFLAPYISKLTAQLKVSIKKKKTQKVLNAYVRTFKEQSEFRIFFSKHQ